MELDAEFDHLACFRLLGRRIVREFSRVVVEVQGTSDAMTVGWFGTDVSGEVNVMVALSANGEATVATGEGMMLELYFPSLDSDEVVERLLQELRNIGSQGVELVRTAPLLGPLSPSWVGPARSPEIVAARAHRHARVIASARPWSR